MEVGRERQDFPCLFKSLVGNVVKATTPCVVAYGYARIRRLVRLGGGR
jgi:hypothetical protein